MAAGKVFERQLLKVTRHGAIPCLFAALVTVFGVALFAPVLAGDDKPRPPVRLKWGLYQILWSRKYDEILSKELAKFSSPPDYVTFYRDLGRPFPKFPIDCVAKQGATTVISLELWHWGRGRRNGSYLTSINGGEYDEFLRQWARDAKADGRKVVLRFGFEFNGNWFTWSGKPKAYVSAWRRAHDIFTEIGATNVEWAWAPNIESCPDTPENNMHLYYPGDRYVDWVGLDGYNFGEHHDEWHHWRSFEEIYDEVLTDFARRYPNKPLLITEIGCAAGEPGQRETWIREAFRHLQRFPQVKGTIWFNFDKRRENEPNFRIDATAESLKAFNETFAKPR